MRLILGCIGNVVGEEGVLLRWTSHYLLILLVALICCIAVTFEPTWVTSSSLLERVVSPSPRKNIVVYFIRIKVKCNVLYNSILSNFFTMFFYLKILQIKDIENAVRFVFHLHIKTHFVVIKKNLFCFLSGIYSVLISFVLGILCLYKTYFLFNAKSKKNKKLIKNK